MATAYAHINPDNLRWARERADLSVGLLATKLRIKEEKLLAWESGEKKPTFKQAKSIAEKTYIPFGFLFLKQIPEQRLPIPDLRSVDGDPIRRPSAELMKIVAQVIARQHWFQEYQHEQGVEDNANVGRFNLNHSVGEIVDDMRRVLGVGPHPVRGTWEEYFRLLIARIEQAGVLVMRQGDLGHFTRPLSVSEFRGFALYDSVAPVIFINQADAPSARLFTLIHELAHIWIGQSGVSDAAVNTQRREEVLCNAVAAEFLVPETAFVPLWRNVENWVDNLVELEAHFHVSPWVLARRALTLGFIEPDDYNRYIAYIKRQYEQREKSGSAPSYYRTVRSHLSESFSRALIAETLSGRVLLRDAGQLLGLKPNQVASLAKEMGI